MRLCVNPARGFAGGYFRGNPVPDAIADFFRQILEPNPRLLPRFAYPGNLSANLGPFPRPRELNSNSWNAFELEDADCRESQAIFADVEDDSAVAIA